MTLKDCSILLITLILGLTCHGQFTVTGTITDAATGTPVPNVAIYEKGAGLLASSTSTGTYKFVTSNPSPTLIFFTYDYTIKEEIVALTSDRVLNIALDPLSQTLTAVELTARKKQVFALKRLQDVEGTAIYAGKKTEVVLMENTTAALATNNARQIYNQVAGLNIYQNDDAGLQLNIGGRGLDPSRTSNFNTRQNGYDISADVLGYPESYYAPAAEGLQEIQVIRGAASLQYGTQFGGLINFKMKEPVASKKLKLTTRNTVGNFGLYTNFTSLSGTINKWSYYSFVNYKKGDGYRPNSSYESINLYSHVGYSFNDRTKITGEVTYLNYLAQQAGGLTDQQFNENPLQSNRPRNWFEVNWLLYNVKLEHAISDRTNISINAFGLTASRDALGFRTNRVSQVDPGGARDLIKGAFSNYGLESRLLTSYTIGSKKASFLIGSKLYKARNTSEQGPGSDGSDANFTLQTDRFPNYANQNAFVFPNLNLSVFSENIFYINDKLSITPGLRAEYIKTESDGYFQRINTDGAGNVILNERIVEAAVNERSFILLGLGTSYKATTSIEFYGNASQNYRSVTFTDISTVNPAFSIDPNITDESGVTIDGGLRGTFKEYVSYDANVFSLFYNNRIGFVQRAGSDGSVKSERTNVGDALLYGIESLIDINLGKIITPNTRYKASFFLNTSLIKSQYTRTAVNGVTGNQVEFVPELNFKTGLQLGYRNILGSVQYSYLSQQFTDASNSVESNQSGVIGVIPSYDIVDISFSYSYRNWKFETGINNALDNAYFDRRATGYPGPGIIPASPRSFYATLEFRF